MIKSTIQIDVELDKDRVPENIYWSTTDREKQQQKARAMLLAFWDAADKSALRIDLWTKDMMVDEMADFFYQTLMTMGDTLARSVNQQELVDDMKGFAKDFYQKFRKLQLEQNKIDAKE
ncbi:gliding motility protein GldC [Arachidicoccus ginsenosidivorans]|jgi:gliding motility-associated protein GldC|uniref:gliding motility protein GldC n=1 Tax=Arachidicoccus ginsenosidivorans TaxID=496057 RepID=UPI001864C4D0|nr:gliding motility protein GldC [Arachidicoccus ginsenosidivorans]